MTWGTTFNTDIDILRLEFQNKYQVQSKIEELESDIASLTEKICMMHLMCWRVLKKLSRNWKP
jgi:hypothetical protein